MGDWLFIWIFDERGYRKERKIFLMSLLECLGYRKKFGEFWIEGVNMLELNKRRIFF